jgi:hypothetical protein
MVDRAQELFLDFVQGEKERALIVTSFCRPFKKRNKKMREKSACLLSGCTVTWIPTPIHMLICFFSPP